jgi:hypothetical protein
MEVVADPVMRLNVRLGTGVAPNGAAGLANAALERVGVHFFLGPDTPEQFVLRHYPLPMPHEIDQDGIHPGFERHGLAGPSERALRGIQFTSTEGIAHTIPAIIAPAMATSRDVSARCTT